MTKRHLPQDSFEREEYLSRYRRTSLRLPKRDYSTGIYHITTCAQGIGGRGPLFLHPVLRSFLQTTWLDLPLHFRSIYVESLVVMPDHVHFMIWMNKWPEHLEGKTAPLLSRIMQSYKAQVANKWIDYIKQNHRTESAKIWQEGYVDRVISYGEMDRIRRYISENPDQGNLSSPRNWEDLYEYMGWEKPVKRQ